MKTFRICGELELVVGCQPERSKWIVVGDGESTIDVHFEDIDAMIEALQAAKAALAPKETDR